MSVSPVHSFPRPRPPRVFPLKVVAAVAPEEGDEIMKIGWVRASSMRADLVVCTVVSDRDELGRAADSLRERVATFLSPDDGPAVEIDVRLGDRANGVLDCALEQRAALLVVGPGSHREGLIERFLHPNLVTELVRTAPFPILMTRYSAATGRTLAAVEMGPLMRPVLEAAADEHRRGSQVHVLHCVDSMPAVTTLDVPVTVPMDDLVATARRELQHAAREASLTDCEVQVELGPAPTLILQWARDLAVDEIIVGTHGRSGPTRLLLGSVAEAVLRDAPCNVMVVRSPS